MLGSFHSVDNAGMEHLPVIPRKNLYIMLCAAGLAAVGVYFAYAHIQEAISVGEAPSDCAAWKTITPPPERPTRTVIKPATIADSETSSRKDIDLLPFRLDA